MKVELQHGVSLRSILGTLSADGLVDAGEVCRAENHLLQTRSGSNEPTFVLALVAAGAWVAAICFVVFLSLAGLIDEAPFKQIGWGIAFLVAATLLSRFTTALFPSQLALAWSVAGHGLLLYGAGEISPGSELAGATIAAMLLCIVLYPLYRDARHRFLSCLAAAAFSTAWIFDSGLHSLFHVEMLIKLIVVGAIFAYRPQYGFLQPLGYAMALSIPLTLFLVLAPEDSLHTSWWLANAILVAALIWLYGWIAGGWTELRREPMVLAVSGTILLGLATTPGVLAAAGLLILGYHRWDHWLLAIGSGFFPIFIVVFYYDLETSLLNKSYMLIASGAILLIARWYICHRGWAQED